MTIQATVTSKGQITLPKALRDLLAIKAGDRVEFIVEDGGVVRMRSRSAPVTRLKGMLPAPPRPLSVEEMDEAIQSRNP
jgi:antitoxin PrlF